jgi:hypothetical protein
MARPCEASRPEDDCRSAGRSHRPSKGGDWRALSMLYDREYGPPAPDGGGHDPHKPAAVQEHLKRLRSMARP